MFTPSGCIAESYPDDSYPTLTSLSCDSRSASVAPLRDRTHRKKYRFRAPAQPIPYSTALATPTPVLSPALVIWTNFFPNQQRRSVLDPKNQPLESTLRANRRRVFEAAKLTESLTVGRRCSCSWCSGTRRKISRRATQEPVKEILEAECDVRRPEWEKPADLVGEREWHCDTESHHSEDERRLVGLIEDDGPVVDTRWAKLVDDAVGVWEGKRRQWVENLGWEVCCSEYEGCPAPLKLPGPESASWSTSCGLGEWTELESSGDYGDHGGVGDGEDMFRLNAVEHAILDVDTDDDGWDTLSIVPLPR